MIMLVVMPDFLQMEDGDPIVRGGRSYVTQFDLVWWIGLINIDLDILRPLSWFPNVKRR